MAQHITEFLKEVNDNIQVLRTKYPRIPNSPLDTLFKHAYIKQFKFLLPEGDPPYKKSQEELGTTPSTLLQHVRKFYTLCDPNLRPVKREQIFIEMLESIHPKEAEVLIAIKDQKLNELYSKITRKTLIHVGYLPPLSPEEIAEEEAIAEAKKNRGPGRPKKEIDPNAPKKKPGRPRKPIDPNAVKRPPGRPRKTKPLEQSTTIDNPLLSVPIIYKQ